MHVVMVFGPIVAHKDHRLLLELSCGATTVEPEDTRQRPNGSVLDRHDIPPELQVTSPTGRGTTEMVGNQPTLQDPRVLTGLRSSAISFLRQGSKPVNGTLIESH